MRVSELTVCAGERVLLDGVSLEVPAGSLTALVGPSGSGKTVLARSLLGALDLDPGIVSGTVEAGPVAWLPQDGPRSLDPLRPLGDIATREALEAVGLADQADRFPHQLSGGMAQRAALARALSTKRPFLVADEPASGVDAALRDPILAHLRAVADGGTGVLWITHDVRRARALADQVVALEAGRVVPFTLPPDAELAPPTAASAGPLVEVRNVDFAYRAFRSRTPVLRGVDLDVHRGERVALVGPSGSGKSTLAHLVTGLRRPDRGIVSVGGHRPQPGQMSQLLPQSPRALLVEGLPLRALLARSARLHGRDESEVDVALTRVGLAHRSDATPDTLSGGELRRAGIARISLARPQLIVADEPVAALDAPLRGPVLRVLLDTLGPDGALLFITHDLELAERLAHRVVRIEAGRIR